MSLQHTLNGDILHTVQTTHTALRTSTQHRYYDVKRWRCSSTGKEHAAIDRPMTKGAIEWVSAHYLPKAVRIEQ